MDRNIKAHLRVRREADRAGSSEERVAHAVTRFTGSMAFVYLHAAFFLGWFLANSRALPFVTPFDPFPFTMLAMMASVEAIFLSTFVLISQNRMARMAERRAELDLQINLLAEHEITRLITMVDAMSEHLGVKPHELHLDELKRDVSPEMLLRRIEAAEGELEEEVRPTEPIGHEAEDRLPNTR